MKINKTFIWGIVIVLLAVGGYALYANLSNQETETTTTAETVETFIGNLDATATASGNLEAQVKANLSLTQAGEVAEVWVSEGDRVTAGDPLLALDTADLQRAVLNAEQTVLIRQSNLSEAMGEASEIEIMAGEANIANAQAKYDDLLTGGSEAEIAAQQAAIQAARADVGAAAARLNTAQSGGTSDALIAAENALADAQTAYNSAEEAHRSTYDCDWDANSESFVCAEGSDDENARVAAQQALADLRTAEQNVADLQPGGDTLSIASSSASLTNAQASLNIQEARLAQLLGEASEADLATAEANIARAQKQLEDLLEGTSASQITQLEVQVAQAEIALERAKNNLAEATLFAPFDGLITAVSINVGESANGVLIELVSESSLEVVLDVDEIDLGSIALGQASLVSFETYPGEELSAEVVSIAPENRANNAGTVVYEVNLAIEPNDLFLLEGMTADAQLITDQREDILLVANEAIKSDRSTDTYAIDVVTGRNEAGELTVEETAVTIGLRDGDFTQITSGLDVGVEVAIGYNPPPTRGFGPGANDD